MIQASSLTKRYGQKTVVDSLDFEVESGIVTGFLGPNGAGKSSTMRMIVGLDKPTSGTAIIDGKHYSEYKNPLRKVGTLLDAKWVHPHRSAANHLKWIAAANSIPRKRVDEVLGIVGLSDVAGRKAGKFSLGMSQRLGLAGALLGDPEVLVLDEPVNGLDPEGIRWVRSLVRALAQEGRTVLISSHLLSEMAQTADNLLVIGKGKLIADSSTHEFIKLASETSSVVRTDHLEEMKKALQEESVQFKEEKDADQRPTLVINGRDTDWVGALAYTYGLRLRELSTRSASLEDAYMRMTGQSVEYHASEDPIGGDAGMAASTQGGAQGSGTARTEPPRMDKTDTPQETPETLHTSDTKGTAGRAATPQTQNKANSTATMAQHRAGATEVVTPPPAGDPVAATAGQQPATPPSTAEKLPSGEAIAKPISTPEATPSARERDN